MKDVASRVRLRGRTLKGKNRIREHGDEWIVLNRNNAVLLVESTESNPALRDLRWVMGVDDPDFEVTVI